VGGGQAQADPEQGLFVSPTFPQQGVAAGLGGTTYAPATGDLRPDVPLDFNLHPMD
jgi:hypothetical protein